MPERTCERIGGYDPDTGAEVIQLTSFPLMHNHPGSGEWITSDDRTLLLYEFRGSEREAPRDLYRVESDGSDLMLLARGTSGGVISADERHVYAGRGGTVLRISLDGDGEEEIAAVPAYANVHISTRSPDGRLLFGAAMRKDGSLDIVRIDPVGGSVEAICRASYTMPVQMHGERSDKLLASIAPIDEDGRALIPFGVYEFTFDGTDFRRVPFTRGTNHYVSLGRTGSVVTTVDHPGRQARRRGIPRHRGRSGVLARRSRCFRRVAHRRH